MSDFEPVVPEGWTVYKTVDGWGATKRFDDHYNTVEVAADGDLSGVCASLDLEFGLRVEAAKQADEATAEDLRSQADALVAVADEPVPVVDAPLVDAPVEDSAPVVEAVTPDAATEPAVDEPQP